MGESPGREEAEQGRPFVGATGEQLDLSLVDAGLRRNRMFIVNAMACRPPENATEPMKRKAAVACRGALLRQLAAFDPKTPVLAMGKWAFFGLTMKDKGVMNARGFLRMEWEIPQLFVEVADGEITGVK